MSLASPPFPFALMVDAGSPQAGCSEAHVFLQPPLLDLGGQSLLPPVTQRQMLAHRAAQKEKERWGKGGGLFLMKSNLKKKKIKLFFFFFFFG